MYSTRISAALSLLTFTAQLTAQDAALGAPVAFEANGQRVLLETHGYTTATATDLNDDGLFDMVVGWYDYNMETKSPSQQGRIYLNTGKRGAPKFGKPVQIMIDGSAELWDTY